MFFFMFTTCLYRQFWAVERWRSDAVETGPQRRRTKFSGRRLKFPRAATATGLGDLGDWAGMS